MKNEQKIVMSFDKWDIFEGFFEKMDKERKCYTFWPSVESIDRMDCEFEKWLFFLCFLYEYGAPPETEEEAASKKRIQRFIDEHLELID